MLILSSCFQRCVLQSRTLVYSGKYKVKVNPNKNQVLLFTSLCLLFPSKDEDKIMNPHMKY